MKIKSSGNLNYVFERIFQLFGRHKVLIITSFLLYNILLIGLGFGIYKSQVPDEFKQKIADRITIGKLPSNYLKGQTALPEQLHIDIKHKHLRKLAYVRAVSMHTGFLFNTALNKVPAMIRYNGETYRVGLSLKGALKAHWEDENMLSLKVKVKDGKTILGMKSFALQHPKTRSYFNEWILHNLFEEAKIINLRYDFVSVDINGSSSKIYALEEGFEKRLVENNQHKEGAILKFESDFHTENKKPSFHNIVGIPQDFWSAKVVPMPKGATLADASLTRIFNKGKALLESFRQNELSTSEVFDVDKLATFFAMVELFGSHHPSSLDNIRFYYNPITSLIEPIIHDNDHLDRLKYHGMLGEEKYIGNVIERRDYQGWWKLTAWYESVFKDPIFYRAYIKELEKITDRAYLDDFFDRHEKEIRSKQKIIHRDYPIINLDPRPILYQNQDYIRQAINPEKLIEARYKRTADGLVELEIVNVQNFAVEVTGASIGNAIQMETKGTELIQAKISTKPDITQVLSLKIPEDMDWTESSLQDLKIHCRILGADHELKEPVIIQAGIEKEVPVTDGHSE